MNTSEGSIYIKGFMRANAFDVSTYFQANITSSIC
jgi:hypothetical protein